MAILNSLYLHPYILLYIFSIKETENGPKTINFSQCFSGAKKRTDFTVKICAFLRQ